VARFQVTVDLVLPVARDAGELHAWCAGLTHEIDRFVPVALPLVPVGGSATLTVTIDADSRDAARLGARSLIDRCLDEIGIPLELLVVSVEPVRLLHSVERTTPNVPGAERSAFPKADARSLAAGARERAEQARHLVAMWMFATRAMQRELPAWLLHVAHVD
jgi:hypothetical protein